MNKLKARNTLYNDPRYDVVVDSRMLEQHLKEKDQQISNLEEKLAESENKVKGFVELFDKKQHENYEQFCEIQELKHQLAEKEKEIVDKIRSKCCVEDKCKDGSFVLGINEKDLDTILKEYQK